MSHQNMFEFFGLPNARGLSIAAPKRKHQAAFKNNQQFMDTIVMFAEIVCNMFKWTLPPSCNPRALEQTLFFEGRALIFKDKSGATLGYGSAKDTLIHTPVILEGDLDIYYEYLKRRAYALNYDHLYTQEDSVLIRNNFYEWPSIVPVSIYADKYTDSGRIIDVYSKTLKAPLTAQAPKDADVTAKIIADAVEGNEVLVVTNGNNMNSEDFKVFSNGNTSSTLLDMWQHRHSVLDEFSERFGINSANTDKRERMITSEVASNNQLSAINVGNLLRWRQMACDEINSKWPEANASVKLNEEYVQMVNEVLEYAQPLRGEDSVSV